MPVQEESLNSGVRANPRSRRITQQWGSGQSPFNKNPRSRRATKQVGSAFKKNHSTVGFRPIPIQEEAVNHGVWPSPFKKNLSIVGFGQSPFKKNHATVGFGSIPVQEESLNSGVRANPCSRRITQQWGSRRSAFKKTCATRQ